MSKKYPEYPLYNHDNCKDLHHQKFCAIVRKDKTCLKKNPKSERKKEQVEATQDNFKKGFTWVYCKR